MALALPREISGSSVVLIVKVNNDIFILIYYLHVVDLMAFHNIGHSQT